MKMQAAIVYIFVGCTRQVEKKLKWTLLWFRIGCRHSTKYSQVVENNSKNEWGLEMYIVQGTRRDSSRSSFVFSSAFRASRSARSLEAAPAAARSKASL